MNGVTPGSVMGSYITAPPGPPGASGHRANAIRRPSRTDLVLTRNILIASFLDFAFFQTALRN